MYRWYHDTHQRKLYGAVSGSDICIIRQEIEAALNRNETLNQEFQRTLKQKLSQIYHRNSFTVGFNNQKRLALEKRSQTEIKTERVTKSTKLNKFNELFTEALDFYE